MEQTFGDFENFMSQQLVVQLAIATLIGTYLNSLISGVVNLIATPIINKIVNKNDINENYKYTILGVQFEIGKILALFINFIMTMLIIYLMFRYIPNVIRKF